MQRPNTPKTDAPKPLSLSPLERILLRALLVLCTDRGRKTEAEIDAWQVSASVDPEDIDKLRRRFGADFECTGLRVLDVGCGLGDLAVSMARMGARVTAIDVDPARIRQARVKAEAGAGAAVRFVHGDFLGYDTDERFDRIFSLEAFEHIPDPHRFLPKMADLLAPDGKILSVFGPTWRSPYGAHMHGFTKLPWLHLYLSERVVLSARRIMFRPTDPATRYEDIRGGLNRMTVSRFRDYVRRAGLRFDRFEINPQLRSPLARLASKMVTSVPVFGELFSHTVLCVMAKSGTASSRT